MVSSVVSRMGCFLLACAALCGPLARANDPTPAIVCDAPVVIAPAVSGAAPSPASPGRLSIEQPQLDINVSAGSATLPISVVNQTPAAINTLSISSVQFFDGKTNERLAAWPQLPLQLRGSQQPIALAPMMRTDCAIVLPALSRAGAFSGSVRVNGNGYEATVPVTIRTRGPYPNALNGWLPPVLMTLVFALGWAVSMAMDRWQTTQLPRLQQLVILRDAQETLEKFVAGLSDWKKQNNTALPKTTAASAFDKSELDTFLKMLDAKSQTDLVQQAQQYGLLTTLYDEFYTALRIAKETIPAASLAQAATALDNIPPGTDPVAYRAALLQVLTSPPVVPAAAPALSEAAEARAPRHLIGGDLSKASAADLHRTIVAMDYVKLLVTFVVVWISAYTVYYLPNPCFGTSSDYLTLFLWSLGLTTAGSQLVTSVRRN